MAAVSAAVVFVSIAAFVAVYSSEDRRTSAVVSTSTIEQGAVITAGDLGQTDVSVSNGIAPLAAGSVGDLIGKRAAVTIPDGSLLVAGDVTGSPVIPDGDAVVGLALKAGQLPATGVEPGDHVMIVQTASPGTPVAALTGSGQSGSEVGTAVTGVLVPGAGVTATAVPATGASTDATLLVSVEVTTALAAAVSTAAAADQVSLVLLPQDSASTASTSSGGSNS